MKIIAVEIKTITDEMTEIQPKIKPFFGGRVAVFLYGGRKSSRKCYTSTYKIREPRRLKSALKQLCVERTHKFYTLYVHVLYVKYLKFETHIKDGLKLNKTAKLKIIRVKSLAKAVFALHYVFASRIYFDTLKFEAFYVLELLIRPLK